jgi:Phosphate starvation-inducible protein PhoH, predicted ATPase
MGAESALTTIEKKHLVRDIDPRDLYGVNDTNLKLLEAQLEVNLAARGTEITIRGTSDKVALTEQTLLEMTAVVARKGYVDKEDVLTILNLVRAGQTPLGEPGLDEVILFTRTDVVKPRTPVQEQYFQAVKQNDMTFAIGPAGTGKTYLAVAFAISAYKNGEVQRIILSRPAVEAGERLGFLPGDLRDKVDPYLTPLYDALFDMLPMDKVRLLMNQRIIEVVPLAYMRGRTLDDAFIILDEAQNATSIQMKMFLTRMGVNSKIIVTGDLTQIDLPGNEESGLVQAVRILKGVPGIAFVEFTEQDVVRHPLVRDIIRAYRRNVR